MPFTIVVASQEKVIDLVLHVANKTILDGNSFQVGLTDISA